MSDSANQGVNNLQLLQPMHCSASVNNLDVMALGLVLDAYDVLGRQHSDASWQPYQHMRLL
jgi:hypothetical protein